MSNIEVKNRAELPAFSEEVARLENKLNSRNAEERAAAVSELSKLIRDGNTAPCKPGEDVNSHIHSIYSFSPYSPSMAVCRSIMAGLATAGIMDHDSVAGFKEFRKAAESLGIPSTQGCELRASFKGTFLENKRINNPDQNGCAYMAFHGVPTSKIADVESFLLPVRTARLKRNRDMTEKLNQIVGDPNIRLNFDEDIIPISEYENGGEITERHILFALSEKLIKSFGKGRELCRYLTEKLGFELSPSISEKLENSENPYYRYDLLGLFKAYYVKKFYIPAKEELVPIEELIDFADKCGIICAYPYLGDVASSVTGDKATAVFEDSYLDSLFEFLKKIGMKAVTYMPSRNSRKQLERVISLSGKFGFFQISGEDINQPRQKFICEAMRDEMFFHLKASAWALVEHERRAEENINRGFFGSETLREYPDMDERIKAFSMGAKRRFCVGDKN